MKFYLWVFVYFGVVPAAFCVALGGDHWTTLLLAWTVIILYLTLFFMVFDIRKRD